MPDINMNEQEYFSIMTQAGSVYMADAAAGEKLVNPKYIAVGDAGGIPYQPNVFMTGLKNQCWIGEIIEKVKDADNPDIVEFRTVLPSDVGGFTVREVAVITDDGTTLFLANHPDAMKVLISSGASNEFPINIRCLFTSAENVDMHVDPNVAVASRKWVENRLVQEFEAHNADPEAHPGIQQSIDDQISGHNDAADAHPAIQQKITELAGEGIGAHNNDANAHPAIQAKIGADIAAHNADAAAHTAIQTKIGADIAVHNAAGDSHSDIRASLATKANKDETDAAIQAAQSMASQADTTAVKMTGDQIISGAKTFTTLRTNESIIILGNGSTITGSEAVSIGISAQSQTRSVAIGSNAICTDSASTAIGYNTNAGTNGAALGYGATASGSNAVALGSRASASGQYSAALGLYASATDDQSIVIGNQNNCSTLYVARTPTVSSDERDKTDIRPIKNSLSFLRKINPIQYVDNPRSRYLPSEEDCTDEQRELMQHYQIVSFYDKKAHAAGELKGCRKRAGVLAQQVQDAINEVYGTDNYADIVYDDQYDHRTNSVKIPEQVENKLSVAYPNFIPFLIGAVQELSEQIEKLQAQVRELTK